METQGRITSFNHDGTVTVTMPNAEEERLYIDLVKVASVIDEVKVVATPVEPPPVTTEFPSEGN